MTRHLNVDAATSLQKGQCLWNQVEPVGTPSMTLRNPQQIAAFFG